VLKIAIISKDAQLVSELVSYASELNEKAGESINYLQIKNLNGLLEGDMSILDYVLIDICDPKSGALDSLERASFNEYVTPPYILIVNKPEDALLAFQYRAFYAIVRSNLKKELPMMIDRLVTYSTFFRRSCIYLKKKNEYKRLLTHRIQYIEVLGHTLTFHMENSDEIQGRGRIKQYEEALEELGFFKCHDCFLVNKRHIEKMTPDAIEISGHSIPVSRRKRTLIRKILKSFPTIGNGTILRK